MMPCGRPYRHPGRALFASLALVANFVAAGVPVLHAWAHAAPWAEQDGHPSAHAAEHGHPPAGSVTRGQTRGDDGPDFPGHPADHGHGPAETAAGQRRHDASPAHRAHLLGSLAPAASAHERAGDEERPSPPAHDHDATSPAAAGKHDHPHEAIHPPSLHDDCLLAHRVALSLLPALPATPPQLAPFVALDPPATHPVSPVASRAPPSADRTRAPPPA